MTQDRRIRTTDPRKRPASVGPMREPRTGSQPPVQEPDAPARTPATRSRKSRVVK